ncbi:uncharacterized protein LOC143283843 [Babylonia areolata]|uniref:uncharacterized protein LOC143283843 n=1 Tax=Babylonia areolata TaxID=304850 RepID=UPI003FD47537
MLQDKSDAPTSQFDQYACLSQLYKLSRYTTEVTYSESCGVTVDTARETASMAACAATDFGTFVRMRSAATCQPCCRTSMSFSVPQTVTDVISGTEYQVKHFTSSYQILQIGTCVSEGAACGYQGTCQQATRIDWVLVELPGGDSFVPTSVPNHCTCIYT